jgi:hypothetical protein
MSVVTYHFFYVVTIKNKNRRISVIIKKKIEKALIIRLEEFY